MPSPDLGGHSLLLLLLLIPRPSSWAGPSAAGTALLHPPLGPPRPARAEPLCSPGVTGDEHRGGAWPCVLSSWQLPGALPSLQPSPDRQAGWGALESAEMPDKGSRPSIRLLLPRSSCCPSDRAGHSPKRAALKRTLQKSPARLGRGWQRAEGAGSSSLGCPEPSWPPRWVCTGRGTGDLWKNWEFCTAAGW